MTIKPKKAYAVSSFPAPIHMPESIDNITIVIK